MTRSCWNKRNGVRRRGALALFALGILSVPVFAEERDPAKQNYFVEPSPKMTVEQATRKVRRAYSGRVLSVRPVDRGYRVRIDVDGRVKTLFVDDDGIRERRR